MDVHGKLKHLMPERGWTAYRLAKESGLSESTLANIFKRNTVPFIAKLEEICNGFHIILSQFFAEGEMVEPNPGAEEAVRPLDFPDPRAESGGTADAPGYEPWKMKKREVFYRLLASFFLFQ